jgi:type II secretory pathway pseudopilin PulG
MRPSRQSGRRTSEHSAESGFMLIAVLFLVALMLIALAVAAPKMAKSIQRDKELELVHRGEQYKRAIKLYYRRFGAYPSNIDQLISTNQVRFLRKRYTDPMTGKDDWKLVYFGQAHVPVLGLFGQPITNGGLSGTAGSSALGGMGPGGVGQPIAGSPSGSNGSAFGSPSGSSFGSSSGSSFGSSSGSSFGGSSFGGSAGGSSFGSSSGGSSFGGSSFGSGTSSGSGFGNNSGTPGTGDPSGSGSGSSTGATGGTPGAGATGSGSGSAFGSSGSSGSTLNGGGPIVGVVIPDTRASMKEYKKQKHYNEWEFVYDPLEDQLQAGGMMGGGAQNLNGATPAGAAGNTTGFGSGFGGQSGSGFGGQSGSGFGGQSGTGFGSGSTPNNGSQNSGSQNSGSQNGGSSTPPPQ